MLKSIKSGKAISVILWMEFWAGHDIVNEEYKIWESNINHTLDGILGRP